jgi:hypothetical protein
MRHHLFTLTLCLPLALAGCDQLGIESGPVTMARREAEGKAVGAGCRHAIRSVEQCYQLNKRADKAAVFAGWREMNDYMRENKVEGIPPEKPTELAEADDAVDAPSGKAPGKKH